MNQSGTLKNADTIVSKSHIQFGSLFNFVRHEDMMKGKSMTVAKMEKSVEVIPKPRTTLFKEGEDDEPMAPQNIFTEIPNMVIGLKFGAVIFDEKYSKNMDKFTVVGLSSNIIIGGATFMKGENMKSRKYIYASSMKVDIT
jgi:hypothetical protein